MVDHVTVPACDVNEMNNKSTTSEVICRFLSRFSIFKNIVMNYLLISDLR